ncbi:MAG: hypothetical protein ACYS8Z_22750 [Planctomycetota bacterium]
MKRERILVRSFMSIRTYAILAIFAVILMILLFSAGCSGASAKSSNSGSAEYSFGFAPNGIEGQAANRDMDTNII